MKPAIGLADLIRALAQLEARGDEPRAIARLLGFSAQQARAGAPAKAANTGETRQVSNVAGTARGGATVTANLRSDGTSPMPPASSAVSAHGPLALRPLGQQAAPQPAWLPAPGKGLTLHAPVKSAPPPLETLFEPRRHRALLSAALATLASDGPLDMERLIERIATRSLDRDLPRQLRPSLHRGAWLLVDRTPAMAPFFDDATDLAARILRVVGYEVTRVQEFTEGPLRIWDAEQFEDRPIELPPPGTPLVAITDLGNRAPDRNWLELLRQLKARGCRAIAVVPYPVERCPPALRAHVTVVPWDRATKVGAVKTRVRRAR